MEIYGWVTGIKILSISFTTLKDFPDFMFTDQIETDSPSKDGCNLYKREEEGGGEGGRRETMHYAWIFLYIHISVIWDTHWKCIFY